jgi:hypothetical protein
MKRIKFNYTAVASAEESDFGDEILDNKEVVLPRNETYKLVISYPLSTPAQFSIKTGKSGMTRGELAKKVCDLYGKVYELEDASTTTKADLIPGMLNRNVTNGMFGIWGHGIGDLMLVDAEVSEEKVITLGVDS